MVQISSWITTWVTLAMTSCIYIATLSSKTKIDAFVIQASNLSKSRFAFGSTKGGQVHVVSLAAAKTHFPEDDYVNDKCHEDVNLNSNLNIGADDSRENLLKGQQSRRSAIETSGKILAGLLLASNVNINQAAEAATLNYSDVPPQTIVMTGMNIYKFIRIDKCL